MNKKHGRIAIVGAPNAGKSTLTNALLGQKLSIVSPKVQTTRNSIKAIITAGDLQLIVIDTPGIFIPRKDKILERVIAKAAWQGLYDCDHICFLIDATVGLNQENQRILQDLRKQNLPITIAINKVDLVKKSTLLEVFAKLGADGIEEILPISATNASQEGSGVDQLKQILLDKCTHQDWLYDENEITDAPINSLLNEITREKLFLNLEQELPYSLTVKTESIETLNNGDLRLKQVIYVLKENQRKIIIGKNGQMIKQIGMEARVDMSDLMQKKIHLFLFVKIQENWMKKSENYENEEAR